MVSCIGCYRTERKIIDVELIKLTQNKIKLFAHEKEKKSSLTLGEKKKK